MPLHDDLFVSGVHLPWNVVEAIEAQVRSGAAPAEDGSSAEIQSGVAHGVLIGFALGQEFRIESIRPGELRTSPGAVGFYRRHRGPGLQPSESDTALIRRLFPEGRAVLLLVKPLSARESVGALFRCQEGEITEPGTSSQEFPFIRAEPASLSLKSAKPSRWLIPSAIAAGICAACLVHCTSPQSDENPIASPHTQLEYPINSSSDIPETKPLAAKAASSATGKLWPSHSAEPELQTR
jgi:hypothetical protein